MCVQSSGNDSVYHPVVDKLDGGCDQSKKDTKTFSVFNFVPCPSVRASSALRRVGKKSRNPEILS